MPDAWIYDDSPQKATLNYEKIITVIFLGVILDFLLLCYIDNSFLNKHLLFKVDINAQITL